MGHDDGCGHRRTTSPKQTWKRITGHHSLTDLDVNRHMYIFAKVVFTGVCLSTGGGGCLPHCILGYTPRQIPPLQTPWADTPWADTPLGRHPPGQTPLSQQTPPGRHPLGRHPWADTPLSSACLDTHSSLSSACWDTHLPVQCLLGYGQQAGTTHPTGMHSVVDLRGGAGDACRPPDIQILSISCSFWEILAKSYVGAPPGVGAPSSGKSWIHHWHSCYLVYFSVFSVNGKSLF